MEDSVILPALPSTISSDTAAIYTELRSINKNLGIIAKVLADSANAQNQVNTERNIELGKIVKAISDSVNRP